MIVDVRLFDTRGEGVIEFPVQVDDSNCHHGTIRDAIQSEIDKHFDFTYSIRGKLHTDKTLLEATVNLNNLDDNVIFCISETPIDCEYSNGMLKLNYNYIFKDSFSTQYVGAGTQITLDTEHETDYGYILFSYNPSVVIAYIINRRNYLKKRLKRFMLNDDFKLSEVVIETDLIDKDALNSALYE